MKSRTTSGQPQNGQRPDNERLDETGLNFEAGPPLSMFVFMRRPDGSAVGYPMTGVPRGGAIEFSTYRKSPKARYLLADDRVCAIVVRDRDPGSGAVLWGRAKPVDVNQFLQTGDTAGDGPINVPRSVRETVHDRLRSGKRVVFRIAVDETRPARTVHVAHA